MVFENPYVSYNCVRMAGDVCIATNGSHTDPIAEKVAAGTPVRDAMVYALVALDYEKDDYNTPRIAAAIGPSRPYERPFARMTTVASPTSTPSMNSSTYCETGFSSANSKCMPSGFVHLPPQQKPCASKIGTSGSTVPRSLVFASVLPYPFHRALMSNAIAHECRESARRLFHPMCRATQLPSHVRMCLTNPCRSTRTGPRR